MVVGALITFEGYQLLDDPDGVLACGNDQIKDNLARSENKLVTDWCK